MVIYTNAGKVPVPEGWALERAVEVLRELGHKVLKATDDGVEVPVPGEDKGVAA
jgi:hypothetical protein